ncbi:Integral membrane protein GPR177 [Camponotus floridanus]|uniref:Protein wntless n=1 Tax=Camponotus floridanus TaxID=104421 RepID=E1ZY20_CAMFO|nr:Integral membrane protein GPR177 [Camponotus floridanus]
MQGTIIENLSGKKLSLLVILLIIAQIVCFLIGGLIAPTPASSQNILGTQCKDTSINGSDENKWFYSRGNGSCTSVDDTHFSSDTHQQPYQIVYTFQMPVPRNNLDLDYSRWQQNLIGVLQVDIRYNSEVEIARRTLITLDARLAYRSKDPQDVWKPYASSTVERILDCSIDMPREQYNYNCKAMPLFELGSLYHDYYLLNIRLPSNTGKNQGLGRIVDLWLTAINQNGGFTKVWVSLKTVYFPIVLGVLTWYWKRVYMLSRSPALLEYMLLTLGSALTFLNLPLEYLTLAYDMPFMLLLGDIRQGIFYATLLSFWLVFAGEHLMLSFIILAGISAGIYLLFLSYMIWKVFKNISAKRAVLPSMSSARRLHYEGVIYRFKFLMIATLLCASLTVVGFILGQVAEGQWKWDEDLELEMTSAFFTGVYGMWNIYIIALLCLYAPSHKQWPIEPSENSISEEIEFSPLPTDPNEMLSLTAFARKTAVE